MRRAARVDANHHAIVQCLRSVGAHVESLAAVGGGIGSGVFGRAGGGRVQAGTPYWVGERGRPELYVPDRDGTIIPEDKVRGGDGGYSFTIHNFHAAGQSPRDISEELLWYAKARG